MVASIGGSVMMPLLIIATSKARADTVCACHDELSSKYISPNKQIQHQAIDKGVRRTNRDIPLLALPLDEELHNLDGIHLVLPDGLQLLQAVYVISSAPVSQYWPIDLFPRPAIRLQ